MKLNMVGRLKRLEETGKETRTVIAPTVAPVLPLGLPVPTLERPLFLMALPKCKGVISKPSPPCAGKANGRVPAAD